MVRSVAPSALADLLVGLAANEKFEDLAFALHQCSDVYVSWDGDNGGERRNTAPPPVWFSAQICPLWARTMVRAMESPMPMPFFLVVKNGSKTSLSLSCGIPGPESEIEITANDSPFISVRPMTVRPSGVAPIASMLFTIRFRITCCSWTGSPLTCSAPGDACK